MTFLKVDNLSLDIPIFGDASLRRAFIGSVLGGEINKDTKNRVSIRALQNVNFELKTGDRLALIGHNGAGKTTLLRALAGIYRPSFGSIQHSGKLIPLFNMSLGVEPEVSGFENIYLIGTFLGMSKSEIDSKIESIIEFTELKDYIYLPAKSYSAGMMTRLAFAVATSTDPEILLLDEQIGAGDSTFTHKVEQRLESFYSKVGIIVLASHSNQLLKKICNKGMILNKGQIAAFGDIDEVIDQYTSGSFQENTVEEAAN